MSKLFLNNPVFAEYTRLLFRLHGLIATEAGESSEADDVRQGMDAVWSKLSGPQRDEARKLSEQLYAFHADAGAEVLGT